MTEVDFEKILKVVLEHVVDMEGTDFLSPKGTMMNFPSLTREENAELTRVRDEYRTAIGWAGYPTSATTSESAPEALAAYREAASMPTSEAWLQHLAVWNTDSSTAPTASASPGSLPEPDRQ